MSNRAKGNILRALALVIDVGAPLTATAMHFPVWVERSAEATLSGIFVFLALISIIPLIKVVGHALKSPAAWMIWTLLFCVFAGLRVIIDEMLVISLVGMMANVAGAVLHKIGTAIISKEDK